MGLETRLDEAREWMHEEWPLSSTVTLNIGFDVASKIAREVVAEKDAEIARLEARVKELASTSGTTRTTDST